jgi:cell wall-associated NlpC family hydrolase
MVASYRAAGISIPHSSSTLSRMFTPVSRDSLRPGDLIFWYSPVHHVAMYEGNGMMVHAQNSRVGVVRTPVSQWLGWGIYYAGARRVVG